MSYARIRGLLKLGAEDTEEGRTAAHLAAKLIEKHQLLDAEKSPLFPASMARFQPKPHTEVRALVAVPATLSAAPTSPSNTGYAPLTNLIGLRPPISAFAVERAKESARLQNERAEADRVARSFATKLARYRT